MIFYTITIVYIFCVFFPCSADMSFLQKHISFLLRKGCTLRNSVIRTYLKMLLCFKHALNQIYNCDYFIFREYIEYKLEDNMKDLIEIRWHGRGGQGAKTAALLLADVAFSTGMYVQGFPEYGPERMGAPITAYNRLSNKQIRVHSTTRIMSLLSMKRF